MGNDNIILPRAADVREGVDGTMWQACDLPGEHVDGTTLCASGEGRMRTVPYREQAGGRGQRHVVCWPR